MAERVWTVEVDPETGVLDRGEVMENLAKIEAAGDALGGGFSMMPLRRLKPGSRVREFETVGWVFRWHSMAPALAEVFGHEPDEAPAESAGEPAGAAS